MDDVLAGQADYYRARAPEYDQWFFRHGRFDRGHQETEAWFAEVEQVRAALAAVPLDGARVLELAPGTGLWTELLVERAASVVAVDASAEMIEQARGRLGERAGRVEFVLADLFDWQPEPAGFDAVVFCFWISHVPAARLDAFLTTVARALRPGGAVFFLDSRREPTSTAADHTLPAADDELMVRRLDNGREFTIVKNFWPADELQRRCHAAGLEVTVTETQTYFQYAAPPRATSA